MIEARERDNEYMRLASGTGRRQSPPCVAEPLRRRASLSTRSALVVHEVAGVLADLRLEMAEGVPFQLHRGARACDARVHLGREVVRRAARVHALLHQLAWQRDVEAGTSAAYALQTAHEFVAASAEDARAWESEGARS